MRPTIQWTPIDGVPAYDLWITNLSTGQDPVLRPLVAGSSWVPTQDLGVGTFRIWVRGRYNNNTYTAWSAQSDFVINTQAVFRPISAAQPTGYPAIEWFGVPGAVHYDLWIDNLSTGQTQFIRNQNILGTSFTPTTPLPAGNYLFWVRATGPGGFLGRYSTRRALNTGGKPSVTSPVGVITDTTPVIAWTPVDGAVRYDLWINRVDTPQAQIVRQTSLTTAEFETSVLPKGTYQVWVRAFTSDDTTGDWSNPWSFSIHSTAATAPSIFSPPAATFNTQPTFTWTALPGATHYLLHVRNLSNSQVVIQAVNITATSFTPVTEMDAGSYRVWVRAYAGNDVLGEFSAPRDFGINTAPVLSVSTSALPGRPSFTWTPVELADRYELLVDRLDIAINGVIHETNLTGVEYTPVEPLARRSILRDSHRSWHHWLWTLRHFHCDTLRHGDRDCTRHTRASAV